MGGGGGKSCFGVKTDVDVDNLCCDLRLGLAIGKYNIDSFMYMFILSLPYLALPIILEDLYNPFLFSIKRNEVVVAAFNSTFPFTHFVANHSPNTCA